MMKTLLWLIVIGLLILLAKRIFSGLVGVIMFVVAIFFSIFMLDTFTIVNVRDHININFYDETRHNPQEAAEKVFEGSKEVGQAAIEKINEVGEKANDRYNTQSIVDVEAVAVTQAPVSNVNEDTTEQEEKPDKEALEATDKKETPFKLPKPKKSAGEIPVIEGFTYYPIKEQSSVVKSYKESMTARDLAILKGLSPFITVSYKGDNFNFHTERGVKGFYIQKKIEEF